MKRIDSVLPRPARYMMVGDGFKAYNYFPNGYQIRKQMDPFLMIDFNPSFEVTPSDRPRGVDVHPHRGFETVTIAWKGAVSHHDSAGNSGTIYPGDVQWMTAGSGILHKEYHEKKFSETGGAFEMAQIWVNLPKADKMSTPKYQGISRDIIPEINLENNGGVVRVIAGNYNGISGAASTFTPLNMWDIHLNKNGTLKTSVPSIHNTGILVVEGTVLVNGEEAKQHDYVLFSNEGEDIEILANENSVLLLLSGEPINEPVAQYGPFVMNTQKELMEAIDDFNSGKFGTLA